MTTLRAAHPRIIIVGGGFLGRLIHSVLPSARVFDWRKEAPTVSSRMLGPQYLWEPLQGFSPDEHEEFNVTTLVDGRTATDERVARYKARVGKELDGGDWRAQFSRRMRGYSVTLPPDRVEYDQKIKCIDGHTRTLLMAGGRQEHYDYLLSTIPLYAFLRLMRHGAYDAMANTLRYRPIFFHTSELPWWKAQHPSMWNNGMRVNYISNPKVPWYRETWREGKCFRESLDRNAFGVEGFGVVPGKIYPNEHTETSIASLEIFDIFMFGRFARWRTDELAHESYRAVRTWAMSRHISVYESRGGVM
jgi:hypothetical protein